MTLSYERIRQDRKIVLREGVQTGWKIISLFATLLFLSLFFSYIFSKIYDYILMAGIIVVLMIYFSIRQFTTFFQISNEGIVYQNLFNKIVKSWDEIKNISITPNDLVIFVHGKDDKIIKILLHPLNNRKKIIDNLKLFSERTTLNANNITMLRKDKKNRMNFFVNKDSKFYRTCKITLLIFSASIKFTLILIGWFAICGYLWEYGIFKSFASSLFNIFGIIIASIYALFPPYTIPTEADVVAEKFGVIVKREQ